MTGVDPGLQFHGSDQSAASSDFIDDPGICFGQFVAPRFLSRIGGFQETVSGPTLTQQSRGPRLIAEQFCNILGCYLSRFLKQDEACRYNAVTDNMPLKSSVKRGGGVREYNLDPKQRAGASFHAELGYGLEPWVPHWRAFQCSRDRRPEGSRAACSEAPGREYPPCIRLKASWRRERDSRTLPY